MAYLQVEGCKLYYELHGSGEPLVLLHGNGEDSSYFIHQIAYFSKTYQVIVMDTRGHGKSEFGHKYLNFELFAKDVYALLQHLHIQKANILGFSDGGNTAMAFALKYPQCVSSLILNGADYDPKGVKRSIQIPIIIGYKILSFFTNWKEELKDKQQVMGLMVLHPHMTLAQLEKIQARTLVIVGTKDMIKESHSKEIANAIANARFEVMEGNHFIANKKPEMFNQIVADFLEEKESNQEERNRR